MNHGYAPKNSKRPKIYTVWANMKARCKNPGSISFKNYGGRGISYDPRWDSFTEFLKDMGDVPEGMTLERIDNDGWYSKSNCRWANWKDQCLNTRRNRRLTYLGRTQTVSEWASELGLDKANIRKKVLAGVPLEKVLSTRANYPRVSL